jgi:hypothetical protein
MNLLRPRSHRKPVRSELDGGPAGLHTEHWDDHQDAVAFVRRPQVCLGDGVTTPGLWFPGHGLVVARERRPRVIGHRRDGSEIGEIMGGAFGTSGLYVDNFIDVFDGTQLAIDTSLTTHKWALFLDALTPDYSANVDFTAAPYTSNQSSGAGYTAGGQTIVSPTTTESPAGTLMYDMADQVWVSPTTVTARGGVLYADVLATNSLIVAQTFGADIVSTAGTFTIAFNALGVFTIDLTP